MADNDEAIVSFSRSAATMYLTLVQYGVPDVSASEIVGAYISALVMTAGSGPEKPPREPWTDA